MMQDFDPRSFRAAASAAAVLQCTIDGTLFDPPGEHLEATRIDLRSLHDTARKKLIAELIVAHRRLVDDVDPELVRAALSPANSVRSVLCVYRDGAGIVVGYLAAHTFISRIDNVPTSLLRAAICLPDGTPRASVSAFFLRQAARALADGRGRPLYMIEALSDPASYAWLYRVADRVWPSPARETPPAIKRLRAQAIGDLGMPQSHRESDDDDAVIRELGRSSMGPSMARRWRRHPRPEVHYFVRRNPGFDRGHGLLTVVPISAAGLLRGLLRLALGGLRRLLPGRAEALPRALPPASAHGRFESDRHRR